MMAMAATHRGKLKPQIRSRCLSARTAAMNAASAMVAGMLAHCWAQQVAHSIAICTTTRSQKVEKGHFWPDSVSRRGHCQLVRLMMGAMRCLVVAPPAHVPWGSARAVTSHACRSRPTECCSVAGSSICGAPADLHEVAVRRSFVARTLHAYPDMPGFLTYLNER